MSATPRILLVLDAPARVEELVALLSAAAPDRALRIIGNDQEALAAIEESDFEIVFAELSGGALPGTQFLNEVWKRRPKTIRFLLGDTIDADVMVTCVLGSHYFLQSPLTLAVVRGALHRADSINKLIRNERIQSLVSRMRTLPSRPSLYLEVMRELRSHNASANTVGDIVTKDLAISSKMIQVVNSAYYGLQQQVTDPSAAVLLLGLETTSSLVLSIEAFARFDKVKPLYFSMDRVWRHCQSVANSAKRIAELMSNDPEVARQAFTAGLLHDIGKLALALNFEEQYYGALKLAEKQKLSPIEVESQVFGASHAEAGAYLLSQWGLPLPIVGAVAEHHLSASALEKEFTATTALHLAEAFEEAAEQQRNGVRDITIDLNYPAELELSGRFDEFREIVGAGENGFKEAVEKREATPEAESTAVSIIAAPLPATGEPAPLIEVVTPEGSPIGRFKKKAILTAVAVSVLLCIGAIIFSPRHKSSPRRALAASEAAVESKALSDLVEGSVVKAAARVPAPTSIATAKLKLQAILFNGAKSSLVINGESFHLGDEVEGARIVSVQRNEVVLEKDGTQRKLSLP